VALATDPIDEENSMCLGCGKW